MATAEIKIKSSFNPNGFDQARNATSKFDKQIKEATHNINAGFQNIKTGNVVSGIGQITSGIKQFALSNPYVIAIAGSFALLAKGISECVKEYTQAEQVQVRFEQTLRSLNLSIYTQYFNNLASIMQKITGISDEVVKDAIQVGLQMGISAKDMEQTIKTASDLSATFGIDLKSAVEMLAKAQEGETTQLTRLLPNLKDTIKNAKDYSEILGVIGDRVKGAAEAQGNTLAGSMNKLKQAFGDLKETIGSVFAPMLENLYTWLTKIVEKMKQNAEMNLNLNSNEIDNKINYYKEEIKRLKLFSGTEETEEGKKKNEELIKYYETQIAILKQQKVANEQQLKYLQQIEKNTNKNTSSEQSNTTTTTKIQQGMTYLQSEHYLLKLEELMGEYIEYEEEQKNVIQETTTNILELSQSIQIISGQFRETERDLTTFKDKLRDNIRNFMSNAFGVDLSSISGFIISILQQMQTFQALKNVMQPIIKMLDSAFRPILQALAPILQVIYQILSPILQLLIPPLILFSVMIANIVQALKALATTIYYIVTLQWNQLGTVKWTAFSSEQITQMIQDAQSGIANASTENPFADVTNTSTTSYSASGARDIYVNIYFNNSYVNGDAREIALKLRDEIKLAEALGY
ncbi:MAG: hypothetical protein QXG00_04820 [Candidatus Woesearchaeota archaeon]